MNVRTTLVWSIRVLAFVGAMSTATAAFAQNGLANLTVAAGAGFNGVEANVRVNALSGAGAISSGYPGAG